MQDYSLDRIRRESIKKIFSCIPTDGWISRLEISEKTGLSLMTVGKITDLLLEKGAVSYSKAEDGKVGRKAKHISLSNEKKIILLLPSGEKIKAMVLSLTLEIIGEIELLPDKEDIAGSLMSILMPFIFENALVGKLVGVGAIYRKDSDKRLCEGLAETIASSLSLEVSLACQGEAAKVNAIKQGFPVLYISKKAGGASVSYCGGEQILGFVSCESEKELEIKLQAIAEFLSVDKIYSEIPFENECVNFMSKQKAGELEYTGAAMLLREKYLLN